MKAKQILKSCIDCDKSELMGPEGTLCRQCRSAHRRHQERKYHFTPEMDKLIEFIWSDQNLHGKAAVLYFNERYPRFCTQNALLERARDLGVGRPSLRHYRKWEREELETIEELSWMSTKRLSELLKENGFKRSPLAIASMLKKLRCISSQDGVTMNALKELMGIHPSKALSFIKSGKLTADRRDGDSGRWFIKNEDIRKFVFRNLNEIELGKVDKLWFVDMLCPGKLDKETRRDLDSIAQMESRLSMGACQ